MVTEKKIGVLMGGFSSEREVSLATGRAVLDALHGKGYDAVGIDIGRDAPEAIKNTGIGAAFIALHGRYGEDGAIQGLLEIMGIPYTGSGILASAIGMDKAAAKTMFKAAGLLVGPYRLVSAKSRSGVVGLIEKEIGFPAVIKPRAEGSSVGVSIVNNAEEIGPALDIAFSYGRDVLVEKYIKGKEVQVGILGDRALGAIEIVPKRHFYDYEAKYEKGMSEHFFPARIPDDIYKKTLEAGLLAHNCIGCRGYSRVDFIVTEDGAPYILEVNTLPGMTQTSLLPEMAQKVGITFPDLVEEILRLAIEQKI